MPANEAAKEEEMAEILERLIHVDWEGPHTWATVLERNDVSDHGLYQIYGCHTVYGAGALIYIGKAAKQSFGQRLRQEGWGNYNQDAGRLEIYLGRIQANAEISRGEWMNRISDAESLLIYAHAPACNCQGVQSIDNEKMRNVHVLNWGNFRNLLPEVSGHRWTSRHYAGMWFNPSRDDEA